MRVLLIAYSVKGPKANYENLFETIKKSGEKYWHYLDSVWLIKTDKSADEVGRTLGGLLGSDREDHVLVIEVTGRAQGMLPSTAWDWINEHVPQ